MDYDALMLVFLYGGSIFFSSLALDRETMLSGLTAALFWLVTALFTFILVPTSMGIAFGWMMGVVSFLFMGVFFYRLFTQYYDKKNERYEYGPL